jgi:[ribosomal protein S5]-alanine N-acetyltransferase
VNATRTPRAPARLRTRSRVALHPLALSDEGDFVAAVRASRALHRPWVHPPATPRAFRTYLARLSRPEHRAFAIRRRDTGALVGIVAVTNIVLGPFRSAFLGYYSFAGQERQGLMREGLAAVVRHAFRALRLHRLEANIQPGNRPSIALAKACGFAREGFSPRYLKIAGRWRDHERWAILSDG